MTTKPATKLKTFPSADILAVIETGVAALQASDKKWSRRIKDSQQGDTVITLLHGREKKGTVTINLDKRIGPKTVLDQLFGEGKWPAPIQAWYERHKEPPVTKATSRKKVRSSPQTEIVKLPSATKKEERAVKFTSKEQLESAVRQAAINLLRACVSLERKNTPGMPHEKSAISDLQFTKLVKGIDRYGRSVPLHAAMQQAGKAWGGTAKEVEERANLALTKSTAVLVNAVNETPGLRVDDADNLWSALRTCEEWAIRRMAVKAIAAGTQNEAALTAAVTLDLQGFGMKEEEAHGRIRSFLDRTGGLMRLKLRNEPGS
jgi:hypothetical protein